MQKTRNSEKGFTLVEVLTTVFIIAIISSIVLINYRQSNRQFALQRTATKLAQDIRKAQQMAMSATTCLPCGGIVPSGGYGIYFNSATNGKYFLYADSDGNLKYTSSAETLETINLESGISITSSTRSINFKPPDPSVNICVGINCSLNDADLILFNGSITRTVKFNRAGLIQVE